MKGARGMEVKACVACGKTNKHATLWESPYGAIVQREGVSHACD